MAQSGWSSNLDLLFRWFHVLFGIIWIGHLYFFNFVNVPFQGVIDKDMKKVVNPNLIGRALWWFRWGAMLTIITGLALFSLVYMYKGGGAFGPNTNFLKEGGGISDRAIWSMMGMLFGGVMWFNVWFIIWPAQKKILTWVKNGEAPAEMPGLAKRALLASKTNAFLSGPMLFGMLAPNHYGSINVVTALVAIGLGLVAIWHFMRASKKVGGI